MPPRPISPSSCSRGDRSAGAGISSEPICTTCPGLMFGSVSRSRTRGIEPTVSTSRPRMLSRGPVAGPNASDSPRSLEAVGQLSSACRSFIAVSCEGFGPVQSWPG